jgi:hypothetical protein
MKRRARIILGLLTGFAVGAAFAVLLDSLGWMPNDARWPAVLICAINGAALGAWGFQWVQVSNEHFDVDE